MQLGGILKAVLGHVYDGSYSVSFHGCVEEARSVITFWHEAGEDLEIQDRDECEEWDNDQEVDLGWWISEGVVIVPVEDYITILG